jgi:tetratricopeptide (TPR) repeat protein
MFGAVVNVVAVLALAVTAIFAQKGPVRGPIEPPRDPEKEVFAKHNLDVARWYITRRKAYQGALDRLKEIVDTYPDFSRIDEVVYFIGEANSKLGKKAVAIDYYKKLIEYYPDSQWTKKARERLNELNGAAH